MIDFYASNTQDSAAATLFFKKVLSQNKPCDYSAGPTNKRNKLSSEKRQTLNHITLISQNLKMVYAEARIFRIQILSKLKNWLLTSLIDKSNWAIDTLCSSKIFQH